MGAAAVGLAGLLLCAAVGAPPGPVTLDLAEVVRRSDAANPLTGRALARYREIEARADLVRSVWLGKGTWRNDFAAIPVCADPVTLPDGQSVCRDDLEEVDYLGLEYRPHLRGAIEYGWPLYTFGKVAAGVEAAEAGLAAGAEQREAGRLEGRYLAKKAYWSALLFAGLSEVAGEGLAKLDEARGRIQAQLDADADDVDERDAWRLDLLWADVLDEVEKARAGRALAEAGLREATGLPAPAEVVIAGALEPADAGVPDLPGAVARALDEGRMLRAARGAVRLAEAEVAMARAALWPDLLVGVAATYRATAAETECLPDLLDRTEQCKAAGFAPIPVPAVRLEWRLDPAAQLTDLRKAEAKVQVARADVRALEARTRLDVQEAWRGVERGRALLSARDGAERAARSLVVSAKMDNEAGVGAGHDMADALKALALARAARLQTIYGLNMAVATLSQLVGADLESSPAAAGVNKPGPTPSNPTNPQAPATEDPR